MNSAYKIPLLRHSLQEASAFRPESLIAAVRAERGLADSAIPEICVLDFDGDLTDWLAKMGLSKPATGWACFHSSMQHVELDGTAIGIVDRTIGGPYAVLIAEQMLATGGKVIVGMTSAGRVAPSLPVPSFVIPTRALRDEGTSYHYLAPSEFVKAPSDLSSRLARALEAVGVSVQRGPVWTTDAPYRETAEQIRRHASTGILAVEMQAASLFALGAARNAPIGVVAHVTNATDHEGKDFDKGSERLWFEVLGGIAKAGSEIIRAPTQVVCGTTPE